MGEYATFRGNRIKIGTCEDMYYLRADQAEQVQRESGSVDPILDRAGIRYRFPWPDEDNSNPGEFADFDRAVAIHGVAAPAEVDHYSVHFTTGKGLQVSLPCPFSIGGKTVPYIIHKNGWPGDIGIIRQRVWDGRLALVCKCMACGSLYRLPTEDDAKPVLDALEEMAKANPGSQAAFYRVVAERVSLGYRNPPAWVKHE